MRRYPHRPPPSVKRVVKVYLAAAVAVVTVLTVVIVTTGCSHGPIAGQATAPSSRSAQPSVASSAVPPEAIGVSPSGVTTRVDVPAQSTEEEYFQACHAAKLWMDARPKTGESPVEPYLAMVQTSPAGSPGSWNVPWANLTPARQAAVITAARAAAADECG